MRERGQVRVVVAEADFNLNHLWVAKSLFYVRELTRPCDVSVKPRGDRTWGDVTAAGHLDIAASMHE